MRSNELAPKIQQLEQALNIIDSMSTTVSEDQWATYGLKEQDVLFELEHLKHLLEELASSGTVNRLVYLSLKQSIFSNIDQIAAHSQQLRGNFNGYITALVNAIVQVNRDMLLILPLHAEADKPSRGYKRSVSALLKQGDTWLSQSKNLKDELDALVKTVHDNVDDVDSKKTEVEKLLEQVEELLEHVQEKDRQTQDALNNAKDAATKSTSELNTAEKNLAKIQADLSKQESLIKHFEAKKIEIANLLDDANKVGLARSFQRRKKVTEIKMKYWNRAFLWSIGLLAVLGAIQLIVIFASDSILDLEKLLVKFLSVTPIIWFAWFSVRQYGFLSRIAEDYAFKEAAAMSFVGYRNEVADNAEMVQLLQEYAIKNFGKNPADLLSKNTEHSSPAHEAFAKLLDKINPKDLFEWVKSKAD
jgi:uncharacterized protein YoxC